MRMNAVALFAALALAPLGCSSNNGNGGGGGGGEADAGQVTCGDGVCDVSEVDTCPGDCGTRGGTGSGSNPTNPCNNDGVCESANGETPQNCPNDCSSTGSGSGSGSDTDECDDPNFEAACETCILSTITGTPDCEDGTDFLTCLSC
ncbi:MAG TPA: hypothetical protein VH143_11670 [Kofleriaceae bacterium]|nr:hypothetical protein [Kofleriaceae bacterium]